MARHLGRKSLPVWLTSTAEDIEDTKIIVNNSTAKALRRCLLHVLPICTTALVLFINIKGVFVGSDFIGPIKSQTISLMLLQMGAKLHELLIVASLGLIILQMIRQELLFGDGMPLGLVGSGLAFTDISFFFSKEFYGALRYVAHGRILRKIFFLTVLLVAGLIAALAGPSSAVLLVPQDQSWPIGGTPFYLNGSSESLWPADLSGDISELKAYCSTENSTSVSVCPGAGYASLWQHWGRMNFSDFRQQDVRSYARDLSGSRFYWPVHSADSLVPPLYAVGDFRKDDQPTSNTFLVQPHAGVASVLQHIADDWWDVLVDDQKMDPRIIGDRQISALLVRNSFSSVRCSQPQNLSLTDQILQLPTIQGRFNYADVADFNISHLNSSVTEYLRFTWVHLPDTFGAASIGGIFESPWTSNNQSRVVIGCTAQLGWIPATIFTDEYTFWTGWYPWDLQYGQRTPAFTAVASGTPLAPTDGRVALGDEWLDLLTPPAPMGSTKTSGWQPTTIESILANAGLGSLPESLVGTDFTTDWINGDNQVSGGKTEFLEAIVASVLVDGLSRTASYRVFNTSGHVSQWALSPYTPSADFSHALLSNRTAFDKPNSIAAEDLTTLRVDMAISGFSFRISLAGFLAMLVLLTHVVMALTHTAWILFNHQSSWSWSGVTELIALAHNSSPSVNALKNAGGGIEKAATFARIAKIRVKADSIGQEEPCVELIFEDDDTAASKESHDDESVEMHRWPSHNESSAPKKSVPRTSNGSLHPSHSKTWPAFNGHSPAASLNASRNSVAEDVSVRSRSSSEERLVPKRVLHASSTRIGRHGVSGLVKVNQAYG